MRMRERANGTQEKFESKIAMDCIMDRDVLF